MRIVEVIHSWIIRNRIVISICTVFLGICLIAVIPFVWEISIKNLLLSLDIPLICVMVLMYLFYVLLRTIRLKKMLLKHDIWIRTSWLFKIVSFSNLIGQFTIGNLGEVTRIAAIKHKSDASKWKELFFIFMVEKTVDAATIGFFALIALGMLVFYAIKIGSEKTMIASAIFLILIGFVLFSYFLYRRRHTIREVASLVLLSLFSMGMIFALVWVSYANFTGARFHTIFILHFISAIVGLLSLLPSGRGPSELSQMVLATQYFELNDMMTAKAIFHVFVTSIVGAFVAPTLGTVIDVWCERKNLE